MLQDYRNYRFSKKEAFEYGTAGFLLGSVFFYFFYQSLWAALPGSIGAVLFCRWKKSVLIEERKTSLERQFREWIEMISGNLQAGYSVENAFLKAGREMLRLYQGASLICGEILRMEKLLENNITLEKILYDLGERSGSEDMYQFADIFCAGKRNGSNLREIIENSSRIIIMKADVEREIQTMLHGRRMEQKIMCMVPFGIMVYVGISSPGYFKPLYHNLAGAVIMTGCMILYLSAVWLSVHIIKRGAAL